MKKDGSTFWAHVILQPVYNEKKKHSGYAKITSDRTEQKRMGELNALLMNEMRDYAIFPLDNVGKIAKWSKAAETIIGYRSRRYSVNPCQSYIPTMVTKPGTKKRDIFQKHLPVNMKTRAGRQGKMAAFLGEQCAYAVA